MSRIDPLVESQIRAHLAKGEPAQAVEVAILHYTDPLLQVLRWRLRGTPEAEVQEAFGDLCERLCIEVSTFRGESAFLTWAEGVARFTPEITELVSSHEQSRRMARARALSGIRLLARAVELVYPFMRRYFRAEVRGLEHVPERQTLIVANHDGGMLPLDGPLLVSAWHRHFGFQRPLHILIHDMLMKLFGPVQEIMQRLGCLRADRHNLEAALDEGRDVLVYPGGSFEAFRSYADRKTVTLGHRTGFVRHALSRRLLITPVVSVGVHETFLVLGRGDWLAEKLGLTRRFRADVFPLVAGLPFGVWPGVLFPQIPLPAKVTLQVLPPIDLCAEEAPNVCLCRAGVLASTYAVRPVRFDRLIKPHR